MRILNNNRSARKFLEGGPMPEEAPMELAPEEAQDPMMQILQVAAQAVQTLNCEAALAVCLALVQIAQGGGAPAGPEPTFARKGAKLTRVR